MIPVDAGRWQRAGRWRARVLAGAALLVATMATGPECLAQQDSARTTRLVGHVVDSLGVPVVGAEVSVLPQQYLRALTNSDGAFGIDSVPVGTVQISVRRLGYAPATFTAELKPGVIERVTLKLAAVAFELPAVSIADTLDHPWLRTFERRRETNHGVFFTRVDIARSQVQTLSNILRRVPGVVLTRDRFGMQKLVFNGAMAGGRPCQPQVFVHTMNYSGDLDDFTADDVEAMEVYTTISTVPAELQTARAQACGAIVIWTREPPPAEKKKKKGGG